jgi:Polyketide cyclase / dehydrase and lipid transport
MDIEAIALRRTSLFGVLLGASYGLVARIAVARAVFGGAFAVMTLGFLVCVPFAMGYLTVRPVPSPSHGFRVVAPWLPCGIVVLIAWLVGAEGTICIVMALPVMLPFASVGGILAASRVGRASTALPVIAILPWVVMPLEAGRQPARRFVTTTTSITIEAPPAAVWPLVVSVDSIRPREQHAALFTAIGFPRPVAATLDRPGVGGVRTASFERGIVFREAIVAWEPERRIRFTITPDAVPATTLDPHVTIGGPYFDVLTGTYELRALSRGRTQLVLTSEHRVSTAFNPYAGWWADRVMSSIQTNILGVLRDRAEHTTERAP